jgi:DNA-binding protein HU-beta
MYKTDVVKRVSRETRLSQRIVADVLTATLDEITETLATRGTVTLPGFGTFYTRERQESTGRDFRRGEDVSIPAMQVAGFRPGQLLKRAVRRGKKRKQ